MKVATGHVTTCVSPHEGHMTSIGRRLVVRSIGFPHRRQLTDIGVAAGACVAPSGGGGGGPRWGDRKPPPGRRQSPTTPTSTRRERGPRTIAEAGAPPTAVDQNP